MSRKSLDNKGAGRNAGSSLSSTKLNQQLATAKNGTAAGLLNLSSKDASSLVITISLKFFYTLNSCVGMPSFKSEFWGICA